MSPVPLELMTTTTCSRCGRHIDKVSSVIVDGRPVCDPKSPFLGKTCPTIKRDSRITKVARELIAQREATGPSRAATEYPERPAPIEPLPAAGEVRKPAKKRKPRARKPPLDS